VVPNRLTFFFALPRLYPVFFFPFHVSQSFFKGISLSCFFFLKEVPPFLKAPPSLPLYFTPLVERDVRLMVGVFRKPFLSFSPHWTIFLLFPSLILLTPTIWSFNLPPPPCHRFGPLSLHRFSQCPLPYPGLRVSSSGLSASFCLIG